MISNLINYLSLFILLFFLPPIVYFLLLAIGSIRHPSSCSTGIHPSTNRFIVAIPAHDEESVIQNTINRLVTLNYPSKLFSIHVVADHCSDRTAEFARQAGAIVHERIEGSRGGKGEALSWLFERILIEDLCDAVVIFDADTQVDRDFLCVMDAHLIQGDQVIQGQHIISNPNEGIFPALTWSMFLIDNRFQNMGRSNLGWSAKNMGDSICIRSDILRKIGWGDGLTEDYQLRQRLLLEEIKIVYEPQAIGYGEAPLTWSQAQAQRARWLRGTYVASNKFIRRIFIDAIKYRDGALMEGGLQARFPSYSTLTFINSHGIVCSTII